MPGWFSVAAPYLADIVVLARPLFTRNKDGDKVPEVVAQQIAELQQAATQNAETARVLATEMQRTIDSLQEGAQQLESQVRRARLLAAGAILVALAALVLAAIAMTR